MIFSRGSEGAESTEPEPTQEAETGCEVGLVVSEGCDKGKGTLVRHTYQGTEITRA